MTRDLLDLTIAALQTSLDDLQRFCDQFLVLHQEAPSAEVVEPLEAAEPSMVPEPSDLAIVPYVPFQETGPAIMSLEEVLVTPVTSGNLALQLRSMMNVLNGDENPFKKPEDSTAQVKDVKAKAKAAPKKRATAKAKARSKKKAMKAQPKKGGKAKAKARSRASRATADSKRKQLQKKNKNAKNKSANKPAADNPKRRGPQMTEEQKAQKKELQKLMHSVTWPQLIENYRKLNLKPQKNQRKPNLPFLKTFIQ